MDDVQGLYGDGRWADPDVGDAAATLAALIDDPAARRAMGAAAAKAATAKLDPARLGAQARMWLGQGRAA